MRRFLAVLLLDTLLVSLRVNPQKNVVSPSHFLLNAKSDYFILIFLTRSFTQNDNRLIFIWFQLVPPRFLPRFMQHVTEETHYRCRFSSSIDSKYSFFYLVNL